MRMNLNQSLQLFFCFSFDDIMAIEGKQVAGEPDSSEEEERERQDMR